jgi:serine/threonine-protein kinase
MALVGAAGVGWAATRETPNVEQAQAAGAASPGSAPAGSACAVRYQLKRDSGSDYEAVLTVATGKAVGRTQWRAVFTYPGTQHLTSAPAAVTQSGRRVTAKGRGALRTFALRGAYRGYNSLPYVFTVDGTRCKAEVIGAATDAQPVSETAGPVRKQNKRHRPPRKSGTPQKRVDRDRPATLQPPGTAGFSLAL